MAPGRLLRQPVPVASRFQSAKLDPVIDMRVRRGIRAVWQKHGLTPGGRRPGAQLPSAGNIGRAAGFRAACEELGGYFQAFAVFLSGRADLLPPAYLEALHSVPLPYLGDDLASPVGELEAKVLRLTEVDGSIFSRNFTGHYKGRPVVIELFSPVDLQAGRRSFEAGLARLSGFPESRITDPDVTGDFQSWLSLHADVERKRRMLTNLREAPTAWVTRIPPLIPELQDAHTLAYELTSSAAAPPKLHDEPRFPLSVEALVEQMLILSFVPADATLSELVPAGEGRVGYRIWPFMEPVPVQHHHSLMQYVASSAAEDPGRAVRMLVKMMRNQGRSVNEAEIWRQLSGLRFEMTAGYQPPASVAQLLELWRASTASGSSPPLFLHLFHRQLALIAGSRTTPADWLPGSVWPVMLRLVRHHLSQSATAARSREWAVGGGMLALGMFRQLGVLLEQIRDNDLSVTVTTSSAGAESNEGITPFLKGVAPVVVFLVSLQFAIALAGTGVGAVSAVVSLLSGAMFVWVAARG